MLRCGEKVVLVDDRWFDNHGHKGDIRPVKGVVSTVRDTLVSFSGQQQIRLDEIRNPVRQYNPYPSELVFGAWRFRPIVSRPTSISVFEEILRKASAPVGLGVG